MKLNFVKVNASGNTTVFVLDPVPNSQYIHISQKIMNDCNIGAEQVGFITQDAVHGVRMDMMGGEFCGNASRSFAAWLTLCDESGTVLKKNVENEVQMEIAVSGHSGILVAQVNGFRSNNVCNVSLPMPLPTSITHGADVYFNDYSLVIFEGISHLILWDRPEKKDDLIKAKDFLKNHDLNTHSFGIMYYQRESMFMKPLVFINNTNTTTWENSCGSGSCALAAALADIQKDNIYELNIHQPGGELIVSVCWKKGIRRIVLSGTIEITVIGTVFLN